MDKGAKREESWLDCISEISLGQSSVPVLNQAESSSPEIVPSFSKR